MLSDGLISRLLDFGFGMACGFALAWLRFAWVTARHIREEVDQMHSQVTHIEEEVTHIRDEKGIFDLPRIYRDVILAVLVAIVAYSAFMSGVASDNARNSIEQNNRQTDSLAAANDCTARIIVTTLYTLGARTQLISDNAAANVRLQKAQAKFLKTPVGSSETLRRAAFREYVRALEEFTKAGEELTLTSDPATYPKAADYINCLNSKE